jgi:serine/threonine-protein kinase RIO1
MNIKIHRVKELKNKKTSRFREDEERFSLRSYNPPGSSEEDEHENEYALIHRLNI